MYDLLVNSTFDLGLNLKTPIPCELYVDKPNPSLTDSFKILWIIEPNEISHIKESVIKNHKNFNLILTWDSEILSKCSNSRLFPFGTSWILDYSFNDKEYKITTLIGNKYSLIGHQIRHKLPQILKDSKIPVDIFNSRNSPNPNLYEFKEIKDPFKKNEIFYSQYHISIENIRHNNYFSEKLIDCFQTKTIPIYFGAPNIGDFFDKRGMFIIENYDDILPLIDTITPETYNSKLEFIESNYIKSMEYLDFRERLKTTILNEFNK